MWVDCECSFPSDRLTRNFGSEIFKELKARIQRRRNVGETCAVWYKDTLGKKITNDEDAMS